MQYVAASPDSHNYRLSGWASTARASYGVLVELAWDHVGISAQSMKIQHLAAHSQFFGAGKRVRVRAYSYSLDL